MSKKRASRTMQITCKRYKELIINHKKMTEAQKRQIRQHQKFCGRHDRKAGLDRMFEALTDEKS